MEDDGGVPFEFRAQFWRSNRVLTVVGASFTVWAAAGAASPGKDGAGAAVTGAVLAVAGLVFTWRAARSACLQATAEGVTVRTLLRTRRWRWADVDSFDVVTASVGGLAYRRLVLVIRLHGGREVRLTELKVSPRATPAAAKLRKVAARLSDCAAYGFGRGVGIDEQHTPATAAAVDFRRAAADDVSRSRPSVNRAGPAVPGREPARMTRDRSLPVNTGGSSERRQTGWQWRSRARTRYVSRMGPIVGYDAAPLLHMAVTQLLTGYVLAMFVLLPLAVFAQVIPDAWLWLPFGITLAPLARALHRTRRLIRQATTTARPFLSARYGVEFPPPPGNTSPAPWRSFINKVLREHGQSPPFE